MSYIKGEMNMPNNRIEVSIIVPVYNEEKHIVKNLKQLVKQNFKSVEFILVNDGSTDNTLTIINDFLNNINDNRFKVYTKENGGASSARNYGIDKSQGQYLMFKDADDLCTNDYVKSYYEAIIKSNTDIAFFGIERVDSNGKNLNWPKMEALTINGKINAHELLRIYAEQKLRGYSVTYISKRSLWKNVRFKEGLSYQEDSLALLELIINNQSLLACMNNRAYYYYVLNPESITRNVNSKIYWQAVEVDKKIINEIKDNSYFSDLVPDMYAHNLTNLSTLIGYCTINKDNNYYLKAREEYLFSFKNARIGRQFKVKRYIQVLLLLINNKTLTSNVYKRIMKNN